MEIKLKKSRTSLAIKIPDEKIIDIIMGKGVPGMEHDHISQTISDGIKNHIPKDIKNKKIAVIIPDDTRLWARGDLFVPGIVRTLFKLGVPKKQIKIIIALGTHDDMTNDKFSRLAGTFCTENVEILNSANKNEDRLVYVGKTYRKTQLHITREVFEAEHIIIFGGILHHMAAGFGGGRKYLLPGIAGYDSIQQNHGLAMQKDGSPHPMVRQAQLAKNPIHEDINDAADMILKNKTCTYVAVAANGMGDIFHAEAGPLHSTFIKGCEKLDHACCIKVPQKADFALISAGGHRADGQLYQSTKALFNAVNIVKKKGKILFVAGCSQGAGNDTFARVLKKYRGNPKKIGKKLTSDFNMPSYVAFRVLDLLEQFEITLVSNFTRSRTEEFGFKYTDDIENYIRCLEGKGYIIPFAENILPVPGQD